MLSKRTLKPRLGAKVKPGSARQTAAILRRAHQGLSKHDRKMIADKIEEARARMANEHLH